VTRVLVPKVHINGKINIGMEKKLYKPMLKGPYVLINELIKSI
jgi:glutaredoxin